MELYEYPVTGTTNTPTLPWKETYIAPIGDVQLGSMGVSLNRLKDHLRRAQSMGCYYLGMGDYIDLMSPSNRARLLAANLYDSPVDALEEAASSLVEQFISLMKDTKGRWLGFLEGHHYYAFRDGTTSDTRIAEALGAPFLGNCAIIHLRFGRGLQRQMREIQKIWCHHGAGGGVTQASVLNKLERLMGRFDCDIFLIGHENKQVTAKLPRIYTADNTPMDQPPVVRDKDINLACTGGWVQGYTQGSAMGGRAQGSYVEKKMLPPLSIGAPILRVRPVHPHRGMDYFDNGLIT